MNRALILLALLAPTHMHSMQDDEYKSDEENTLLSRASSISAPEQQTMEVEKTYPLRLTHLLDHKSRCSVYDVVTSAEFNDDASQVSTKSEKCPLPCFPCCVRIPTITKWSTKTGKKIGTGYGCVQCAICPPEALSYTNRNKREVFYDLPPNQSLFGVNKHNDMFPNNGVYRINNLIRAVHYKNQTPHARTLVACAQATHHGILALYTRASKIDVQNMPEYQTIMQDTDLPKDLVNIVSDYLALKENYSASLLKMASAIEEKRATNQLALTFACCPCGLTCCILHCLYCPCSAFCGQDLEEGVVKARCCKFVPNRQMATRYVPIENYK